MYTAGHSTDLYDKMVINMKHDAQCLSFKFKIKGNGFANMKVVGFNNKSSFAIDLIRFHASDIKQNTWIDVKVPIRKNATTFSIVSISLKFLITTNSSCFGVIFCCGSMNYYVINRCTK